MASHYRLQCSYVVLKDIENVFSFFNLEKAGKIFLVY